MTWTMQSRSNGFAGNSLRPPAPDTTPHTPATISRASSPTAPRVVQRDATAVGHQQRACLAGALSAGALPPGSRRDSSFRHRLWSGRHVSGTWLPGGRLGNPEPARESLDLADRDRLRHRL